MRRILLVALSLACLAATEQKTDEKPTVVSVPPPAPMFAVLPSGKAYTLTIMGPVRGPDGKRLAFGIGFIAPSSDGARVRAAAVELVNLVGAEAIEKGEEAILLAAYSSYDPTSLASRNTAYNFVFTRKSGKWETEQHPASLPSVTKGTRQLLEGWGGFRRDAAAEPIAAQSALRWLQLMDGGRVSEAFGETTKFPGAAWDESRLQAYWDHEFRPRGPVRERTLVWWLHRWIPEEKDQPPHEYLVVSYMTRVGEEQEPFPERVTLRRDDDGKLRVAGVWTPRP
jgi:hypothetical protein